MKTQTIKLTLEEIMLIRDCIVEETVRTRRYLRDMPRPSDRLVRRAELLNELMHDFKNRSM